MKINKWIVLLLAAWLVAGCAKIMPLTGGDKDQVAPRLKKTSPDTFSTQFKGKEIQLSFDEFVTIDEPSRNILFSPALKSTPSFVTNSKGVTIKFKEDLEPNTTYTIRMQNAIKDLNEGNKLEEQLFVFSTGPEIDSGLVSGLVLNYLDNAPVKDVKVGLYPENMAPELVKTQKPLYWSMTRMDGTFDIPYIKKGQYKIFAIKEEDGSFMYDRAGEGIAYLSQPVRSDSVMLNSLFLFTSSADSLKLVKSKYRGNGSFSFIFSRPIKEVEFQVKDSIGSVNYKLARTEGDSVLVWLEKGTRKSADFIVKSGDLLDTVSIKVREIGSSTGSRAKATTPSKKIAKYAPILVPAASNEMSIFDTLAIQFPYPVYWVDSSKVSLKLDTLAVPFSLIENPRNPLQWKVIYSPKGAKEFNLKIDYGAFVTYTSGDTLDSLVSKFSYLKETDYSKLAILLKNKPLGSPLLLSLTKDKKIVFESSISESDTLLTISNLAPGKYSLQAFIDSDGNGKLSEGDFSLQKLPERLFILPSGIIIRRGFDQKVLWDFVPTKTGR